jgi:hypothetical protein
MNFKNRHMRTVIWLAALAWLIGSGCNTNKAFTDDMYFSLDDAEREYRTYQSRKELVKTVPNRFSTNNNNHQNQTEDQQYSRDSDGNLIIRNNYYEDSEFNFDDYYDYAYSARIRRFGNSWNTWNYYDPFYTNYYWYNPMPMNWGTSIYQTYTWWGPSPVWPYGYSYNSYSVMYSWGNGWGWNSCNNPYCYNGWGQNNWWNNPWHNNWNYGWWNPYDPWCYSGWNNPWNYNSGGYNNGFWNGYNQGYWNGFNNGMTWGNMYFNSFDNNSYYYGPRLASANNSNATFSFSKMMQQNGIEKDLVSNRIKDVPVSPVDKGRRYEETGNTIQETGREAQEGNNTNRGNIQADKFTPVGGNRTEQQQQNGKDVIIIRNYDENQGTRGSQVTRQNENLVPVNRDNTVKPNDGRDTRSNSTGNNPTNSNNTYRNWNTGGKENFNIERKQEGGQRSGTFTEGSRSYQNNSNYFNRREERNSIQPNQQQQPSRGNNQGGGVPSQRPR